MPEKSKLQSLFDALTAELSRLYGASHTHDFQDELDALEAEIVVRDTPVVVEDKDKKDKEPAKK